MTINRQVERRVISILALAHEQQLLTTGCKVQLKVAHNGLFTNYEVFLTVIVTNNSTPH